MRGRPADGMTGRPVRATLGSTAPWDGPRSARRTSASGGGDRESARGNVLGPTTHLDGGLSERGSHVPGPPRRAVPHDQSRDELGPGYPGRVARQGDGLLEDRLV